MSKGGTSKPDNYLFWVASANVGCSEKAEKLSTYTKQALLSAFLGIAHQNVMTE